MHRSPAQAWVFGVGAALVLLVAVTLRFAALDFGLPNRLTRPDEAPVVDLTGRPARGDFDLAWSVYPSAYVYLCWGWADIGLRVGQAAGLFPAGDYTTTLRRRPAILHLLLRTLSATAGVAAVALLIVLGRRTLGDLPALGAGALLAASFLHARDSHAAKPEAMLALAVVVAFLAMVPLARRATFRSGILAGVGVGAAMAAKYPGFLLLVPVYVGCVVQSEARGWRRLFPLPALAAGGAAAAVFLATSPFLLSPASLRQIGGVLLMVFPMLSPERAQSVAAGLRFEGPLFAEGPVPPWWSGYAYHASVSLWYGAGALVTLLAPAALLWGCLNGRRITALLACFVLTYFGVVGLSPTQQLARYVTPLLAPLLLLEAGFLHASARRLAGRAAPAVFALAVVLVAAEPLAAALAHNRILARTDTRLLATRWLAEHASPGMRVAVYGTRFYPWGAPHVPRPLVQVDARPEAADLAAKQVGYLVTHDHPLVFSTTDPAVLEALAHHLTLVADFAPYDPARAAPIFDRADAYYVPIHAFAGVERPGPHVRIYRFE